MTDTRPRSDLHEIVTEHVAIALPAVMLIDVDGQKYVIARPSDWEAMRDAGTRYVLGIDDAGIITFVPSRAAVTGHYEPVIYDGELVFYDGELVMTFVED